MAHTLGNSSSTPRRFSLFARPLADTLTQLVRPVYKKHGFAEHRILTQWPAIVGPELSRYSVPQKLSLRSGKQGQGTLHVLVACARALELQHMQPVILSRITAFFGYEAVSRLAFTQVMTDFFGKKEKKPVAPEAVPDAAMLATTAQCADEELRAALLALGKALAAVEN